MELKTEITCPQCRRKLPVRVAEMVPGREQKCVCGLTIKFKGDDGRKAQNAMDDLERTLKSIKPIKINLKL